MKRKQTVRKLFQNIRILGVNHIMNKTEIKEDNHYDKLRRRGISGVKLEILLVCIGHNLRRYHTRKLEFQKNTKLN